MTAHDTSSLAERLAKLEQAERRSRRRRRTFTAGCALLGLVAATGTALSAPSSPLACDPAHAGELYCFGAGQPALASQINHNFEQLADQLDTLSSRADGLDTGVARAAPTGTIVAYGGTSAPAGWLLCDGRSIGGNSALAGVLGRAQVPDLRDRFVLGAGTRARHATGGEASVTLTVEQLPAHTHEYIDPTTGGYKGLAHDGSGSTAEYAHEGPKGITSATGGGQAHNNMPPFYVLTYIIKQ